MSDVNFEIILFWIISGLFTITIGFICPVVFWMMLIMIGLIIIVSAMLSI